MRNDMFNWLLRKKQTMPIVPEVQGEAAPASLDLEEPGTAAVVAALPPENLETVEPAAPVMELATGSAPVSELEVPDAVVEAYEPELAVAAEPASVPEFTSSADPLGEAPGATPSRFCGRPLQPFTTGVSRPKPLLVLQGAAGEIDLRADLEVVEHSGRQTRRGKLIAVRADGRRLLAKFGGAGRIRAYTLRRDGIYRLEGANDARAPVLELANAL